jgi:TPR repeat protein
VIHEAAPPAQGIHEAAPPAPIARAPNASLQPPALQVPEQAEPDPMPAAARTGQAETRRQRIAELFSQPVSAEHRTDGAVVPISMQSDGDAGPDAAPAYGEIDLEMDPDWDLAPDLEPEPEPQSEPQSEPEPATASPGLPSIDRETETFVAKLLAHATDSAAHLRYLENAAGGGNRWAKLEAAATFLTISDENGARTERAIAFLRDVAEAQESYLGVGKEAAYFLGEIYRLGYRNAPVNEDLALKYLTRAASEGHSDAKMGLAAVISKEKITENAGEFTHPIIESALTSREASAALLQMLENDWSLSYQDGVMVVLRTLVDQGDHLAAKLYGKHLLETEDYKIAPLVLMRADVLDDAIIDKIMDVVQSGRAEDDAINALVDCLGHHADKGDSYANYQMAVSYNNGIGVPQDDIMAFVHANLAASRVHGRERDHLTRLRDELRDILSEPELAEAQDIIRERFLK